MNEYKLKSKWTINAKSAIGKRLRIDNAINEPSLGNPPFYNFGDHYSMEQGLLESLLTPQKTIWI
jgi:hypothetical protein